jgi:hypothetical protein
LYLLSFIRWQQNLCHLDSDYYLARAEVSPGFVIGRPAWPTGQDRARWLEKTEAIEVSESELNDDTRHRLSSYEVIDVSR